MNKGEKPLILISNNVRGFNLKKKRILSMQILMKDFPDILILQETRLHKINSINDIKKIYANYNIYANLMSSAKLGTLTFIKKSLNVLVFQKAISSSFFLKIQIKSKSSAINIYNVHMPHKSCDRIKVINVIKKEMSLDPIPSIIGGDWNISNIKESNKLRALFSILGMKELKSNYEISNSVEVSTFKRNKAQSRLDRVFVSNSIKSSNLTYIVNPYSDHLGMKFDFPFSVQDSSSSPKKFISFLSFRPKWWLLKEISIKNIVKESISTMKEYINFFSPSKYWNIVKTLIKQKIFDLQINSTNYLFHEFETMNKLLSEMVINTKCNISLFETTKIRLIRVLNEIYKIQRPRSNSMYHLNDMNFLKHQYSNYRKSSINPIFNKLSNPDSDNEVILKGQKIAEILKDEYFKRSLNNKSVKNYKSNFFPERMKKYKFFKSRQEKLSKSSLETLNSIPSFQEYKAALKDISHSLLPGPDSLNSTFYNLVDDDLFELAYRAKIEDCDFNSEDQSDPMISALLFPIPKRSNLGEALEWNNIVQTSQIRFIALINTDEKAWNRILNSKLNLVLPSIVLKYCFSVPKRNLQQAVLLTEFLSNSHNINRQSKATFIKLDFTNAFDLTSHTHLLNHIKSLIGSGWFFDQISRSILKRKVSVLFNNFTSSKLICSAGLLQGCPLSASLYTLYMELLTSAINRFNRGMLIGKTFSSVKSIHYIDDVIIACRDREDEISAWKIINDFCWITGAKLNESKTETISIYLKLNIKRLKNKIKFFNKISSSKLYGMYPFGNQEKASSKIFETIMKQIDQQISNRSFHTASLSTKVKIINTVFTSKFVYFLPLLKINNNMINRYLSKCSRFLWNRFVQVPMKFISLPQDFGGLGLINLKNLSNSLKINFYEKIKVADSFSVDVGNIISEYYYRKYIKNDILLNKIKYYYSTNNAFLRKYRHSEYSRMIASMEGYSKLPSFFYKIIRRLPYYGGLRSFIFKLIWKRLPTAYHLKNFRHIATINDICQSCNSSLPETFNHLMFECISASQLRSQISKKFQLSVNLFPINFDISNWNKQSLGIQFINLLMMQSLWLERNARLFGSEKESKTPMQYFKEVSGVYLKFIKKLKLPSSLSKSFISIVSN